MWPSFGTHVLQSIQLHLSADQFFVPPFKPLRLQNSFISLCNDKLDLTSLSVHSVVGIGNALNLCHEFIFAQASHLCEPPVLNIYRNGLL